MPNPHISVIIATRNRAEALRTISLPSLAKQDTDNFELIVWDASDDNASQIVVQSLAMDHPATRVRYYRAPRLGSCAQRNDAVKEALGEIIFFIDDDCEVSPDGIGALSEMFGKSEALAGGALPLQNEYAGKKDINRPARLLSAAYSKIFYTRPHLSGMFSPAPPASPGPVQDLWGCNMAYRKEVFRDHRFDERLQRYGGYALWEDKEFSHRLHREGKELSVADRGQVVHRPWPEPRMADALNRGRITGYNAGIVWKNAIFPFSTSSLLFFVWARLGFLALALGLCACAPWNKSSWRRVAGYCQGLLAFLREEIEAR